MKYAGRIYTAGVQDYCSFPQDSREEAAAFAFRARPKAESCITTEVHDGVPTHVSVEQHHRSAGDDTWSRPFRWIAYLMGATLLVIAIIIAGLGT